MNILEKIRRERVYFDGSAGTYLQERGYDGQPFELNLSDPDAVVAMHRAYIAAGCDILTANTFGLSRLKSNYVARVVDAAISNARRAIAEENPRRDIFIALDIGPTGKLLKPLGDLEFEEAVSLFAETVRAAGDRCDLILIETQNDCLETKAAVLAAKENSRLPVFVCNTYDAGGKLLTGATPRAMVAMLEGLGVDALGVNCGVGPDKMLPVIRKYAAHSSLPLIAMPNAGLPDIVDGRTVYNVSPESFAEDMRALTLAGASILGGCCGTSPVYIERLISATRSLPRPALAEKHETVVSSYTKAVQFADKPLLIGERINPTGKPKLKEALRSGNTDYILQEALRQQEAGADLLDVNVGLPELDEREVLPRVVAELQSVTDLPLQIDTSNPDAMERAMRVYNGKPMLNSVSGKKEVMARIFPLMKKYGGVAVALLLDDDGIPPSAEGRIGVAEKILSAAAEYGVSPDNLVFDPLCMAISADSGAGALTLRTLRELTRRGYKTVMGLSNVSFGLPARERVNSAFLVMALEEGLSSAIVNPLSDALMGSYRAFMALSARDERCEEYIAFAGGQAVETARNDEKVTLKDAVLRGLKDSAADAAKELLQTTPALRVIDEEIIPALDEVGKGFERKTVYLPGLLMSAEAAKAAFSVINDTLKDAAPRRDCPSIILATVRGDIHDIGKNIVRTLLENYGFPVNDLGKDVPVERVVNEAVAAGAKLVGLSALMTTTVPAMEETVKAVHAALPGCKVAVGGAVLKEEYARMIGADKYCRDAMETVRYAEEILG